MDSGNTSENDPAIAAFELVRALTSSGASGCKVTISFTIPAGMPMRTAVDVEPVPAKPMHSENLDVLGDDEAPAQPGLLGAFILVAEKGGSE